MVCACYLLFEAVYFFAVFGFPIKCLYGLKKDKVIDAKWIYYFFLLIIIYLGESTFLFPLKYLLNKIDFCMFQAVKAIFAVWLYYPCEKNGINIIENLIGKHLETAFVKINGIVGKYFEKIGIPNRCGPSENKSESDSDKRKFE